MIVSKRVKCPPTVLLVVLALLTLVVSACAPAAGVPPDPHEHGADGEGSDRVFSSSDLKDRFDNVDGYAQSAVLPSELGATRGGFLVDLWQGVGDADPGLEVRGVFEDGATTEWMPAQITWRENPHVVAIANLPELVRATQFRLPMGTVDLVENIVYGAVVPLDEVEGGDDSDGTGKVSQALTSELNGLVQTRAAWGARKTRCSSKNTNKYRMAIHHTYTPTSSSGGYEARLRGIQSYHMDNRGWCDVGYHFLITADGRVWEGRPLHLLGSHVGKNNTGNIGFSWVGCYHPGACNSISSAQTPPQSTIEAAGKVIGKLADKYGIAINSSKIKPHRGHSGASTSCPGDNLNARIPDIMAVAKNGGGSTPPPPDPTEPPPSGNPGRALGVAWDLSSSSSPSGYGNKRIPGATISVQGGPSTTARAGDAFWTLDLAPGTHVVTASAPGFATATKTIEVKSGYDTWSSMGLTPGAPTTGPGIVDVSVVSSSGQALSNAIVYVPGAGAARVGSSGSASFTLEPGGAEVQAYADGYAGSTKSVTVVSGSQGVTMQLSAAGPLGSTGRLQGVVWDKSTASSPASSSATRLDSTIVICSCGQAKKARAGDAYWYFDAPTGNHTFTVVAAGFKTESFSYSIGSGASDWNSVGMTPGSSSGGTGGTGGTGGSGYEEYGSFESSWSCSSTAGNKKSQSGSYYVTSFGCWIDSSGNHRGDPSDNCIPWCMSGAASQGRSHIYDPLCGSMSGPDCERSLQWYTAGADRFGCGARVKVTNPKNGKSAVLAVIDRGPACWVENKVDHWVLDMSYPASYHLFNEPKAATEKGEVIVEQVSDSTPLGPA